MKNKIVGRGKYLSKLVCAIFSSIVRCGIRRVAYNMYHACNRFLAPTLKFSRSLSLSQICCGTKIVESVSQNGSLARSCSLTRLFPMSMASVRCVGLVVASERVCFCLLSTKCWRNRSPHIHLSVLCFAFCLHKIMGKFNALRMRLGDARETSTLHSAQCTW